MRAMHMLLIGSLGLFLGGCSGGTGTGKPFQPPPPLNKDLLVGKWKSPIDNPAVQFIARYEFASDGTLKITFAGMKQPLPVKYSWSGERDLDLEYPTAADLRQAYAAAVKDFKDRYKQRVKDESVSEKALSSLLLIPDELPAKETFRVATSTDKSQVLLFLTDEKGSRRTFEKVD